MSEPRTEAGRLLLHSTETQDDGTWSGFDLMRYREVVLAIEAEAAALERERFVEKAHTYRSMFSESEWGAVCFLLYVEKVEHVADPET